MDRGKIIEEQISSVKTYNKIRVIDCSIIKFKPENRAGAIEQLAQNVEAVEKQVQLMDVKMSRNYMQ